MRDDGDGDDDGHDDAAQPRRAATSSSSVGALLRLRLKTDVSTARRTSEELEELVGVVIEGCPYRCQWYAREEDFFDSPSNFPDCEAVGDYPNDEPRSCGQRGCCHDPFCGAERGRMCMPADEVFRLATRLHEESGGDDREEGEEAAVAIRVVGARPRPMLCLYENRYTYRASARHLW